MVIQRKPGKMTANTHSMTVRPPAVAGLFYAGDRDRLQAQVLDLLASAAGSTKFMLKALSVTLAVAERRIGLGFLWHMGPSLRHVRFRAAAIGSPAGNGPVAA
jgi:hypothetical protein